MFNTGLQLVDNEHCNREYILKELLGTGNFGSVYLAVSKRLNKECAIKFISHDKINELKVYEELITTELKALQELVHPHIP